MLAFAIITIIIIVSSIVHYNKTYQKEQEELKVKQKEKRIQQEFKVKQKDEQKLQENKVLQEGKRMLQELKEKESGKAKGTAETINLKDKDVEDAMLALTGLGFAKAECVAVLTKAIAENVQGVQALIAYSLKNIR